MGLNVTSRTTLRILMEDTRTPFSEITRRIDMLSATAHDWVGWMEDAGVIEGYHAHVDSRQVGLGTSALVGFWVKQDREKEVLQQFRDTDGIQEVNLITGEWDVMLRMYVEGTDILCEFMFSRTAELDSFLRPQTMVVLGAEYNDPVLPIRGPDDED